MAACISAGGQDILDFHADDLDTPCIGYFVEDYAHF
jgi:hypothetical protein